MKITLMHNPKAGRGNHDKRELLADLIAAGHDVRYQSTKKRGYHEALGKKTDLVVAAGGDGTIAKVASRLIGTGIPFSVLPLGTANNLARSLGFANPPKKIIAELRRGRKRTFDIGVAKGPWGKRYFFESADGGLLAEHVRATKGKGQKAEELSKQQQMKRHVSLMREMLRDYEAQHWKIDIDGQDFSDRYILWEAMNIRSIGPALYLAPRARIKDGRFDLVLVRKDDRATLMKYLDARLAGRKTSFPLSIQKFRKLKLIWDKPIIHFDDEPWPKKREMQKGQIKIKIVVSRLRSQFCHPENNRVKSARLLLVSDRQKSQWTPHLRRFRHHPRRSRLNREIAIGGSETGNGSCLPVA